MTARRARDDRGSTAELTITMPVALLLAFVALQMGVWGYGHHIAQAITTHGMAATRTVEATEHSAQAQTEQVADQLGGAILHDVAITTQRDATTARVRVEAHVPSAIPGLAWPIAHELTAPVERLDEDGARP